MTYASYAHHPTVMDRLSMRERARALGDVGLERACNADLARFGYRDMETVPVMETTAVVAPERAVPKRPGRRPLPRCEHNKIVGRCDACGKADGR